MWIDKERPPGTFRYAYGVQAVAEISKLGHTDTFVPSKKLDQYVEGGNNENIGDTGRSRVVYPSDDGSEIAHAKK